MNNAEVAELWHRLMTEVLGYKEYAASGGDMGRGVTCYLAARYPKEVKGIHLTDVGMAGDLVTARDEDLTLDELAYKYKAIEWQRMKGAYINIQSTKPQSLAYALSDLPAGMAAWIVEKYHAWSDWPLLTMDDLCDCLTLYWVTNTACTSSEPITAIALRCRQWAKSVRRPPLLFFLTMCSPFRKSGLNKIILLSCILKCRAVVILLLWSSRKNSRRTLYGS